MPNIGQHLFSWKWTRIFFTFVYCRFVFVLSVSRVFSFLFVLYVCIHVHVGVRRSLTGASFILPPRGSRDQTQVVAFTQCAILPDLLHSFFFIHFQHSILSTFMSPDYISNSPLTDPPRRYILRKKLIKNCFWVFTYSKASWYELRRHNLRILFSDTLN